MKRLILVLAMFGLPVIAHANMTGQELDFKLSNPYYSWAHGYAYGYIDGVIDAALGCPHEKNFTHGQAWQMVQNYLEAHPERWNKDTPILIKEALDPVCKYGETK